MESFCEQVQGSFGEDGTMYINLGFATKLRLFVQRISYLRIISKNTTGEDF